MSYASDKKRLLYQATHRGTKESDLLLGGFVKKHIDRLSPAEFSELEAILTLPDEEIVCFILRGIPLAMGKKYALLEKMKNFHSSTKKINFQIFADQKS